MANKNVNVTENTQAATAEVAQQAPVVEQVTQAPVAAPVQTTQEAQVPAAIPSEEKPKFWDRPIPSKIKKVGKWVGLGAAVVGGLIVAHKMGEASGFDKATDAYNNASSGSNDPEPDTSPDDENDLGEASYTDVTSET